ncbi:MAG: hypothetical protein DI598_04465 [Pseudopedobacter saltans]|uniref:Glycosyltransferase 2-like domain-containing protein n=1 Tax=Pseudopedobacter saltans TaxID=151895 RepID=A0A2W5FBA9_9SPHI|nr:MAG: hypothetical protein DI598_04465 [Pseudopedobacter saltans]
MEKKYLLSICIPTYNRVELLKRCLDGIFSQITHELKDFVEVIVSNNASTDNTEELIKNYGNKVNSYYKNESNIGPDGNIASCFDKAKGKFVWIFSDDEYLVPKSLIKIFNLLEKNKECGVCFIQGEWIHHPDYESILEVPIIKPEIMNTPAIFFERVSYWITFITSNIVNKDLIKNILEPKKYLGTNLVQLSWVIPAIYKATYNIFINEHLIICKDDNTGGYKIYQVFVLNFNKIMTDMIKKGIMNKKDKRFINNKMLVHLFPYYLNRGMHGFLKENPRFILISFYWNYSRFWKGIFPLLISKKSIHNKK